MAEEFQKLTKKLVDWKNRSILPKASDYPDTISLDQKTREKFRAIEKYTGVESSPWFGEKKGATGWEYSVTLFYFGGQLIVTRPNSGNSRSVTPQVNISKITQQINQEKKQITFEFSVGENSYKTEPFPLSQWLKDSNADQNIAPIAISHTHPKNYLDRDKYVYTFFSEADIRALSIKGLFIEFMVAGENIWMVAKTNQFGEISVSELYKPTEEEIFAVKHSLSRTNAQLSAVVEHLSESGLIFYHGTFGQYLRKVNMSNFRREIESYRSQKQRLNIKKAEFVDGSTVLLQHSYDANDILLNFQSEEPKPIQMKALNQNKLQEIQMKKDKFKKDQLIFVVSIILVIMAMIASIIFILFFL